MEKVIDILPHLPAPKLSDWELEHEMFEATSGSLESIAEWLGGLLRVDEEPLPNWYFETPFVLGFAFSFCGAVKRDWNYELEDADYAREVFITLFGDARGAVLHRLALDHLGNAQPDFVLGTENGALFHGAYANPEESADDPLFAEPLRRAKERMEKTLKHTQTGATYRFSFAKYFRPACYDVYFLDILRERFPDKADWRQSALESLPNPDPDDIDYASLSEDQLRVLLLEGEEDA